MPIYNGGGGVAGITVEVDPTALKMASNLSDLISAGDARTNLDVYDTGTTDTTFLALAGGTMTGAITFDATGLQNINKGTFDNSTGGYNGISLTCAVGYELNWQGGHLGNWYSGAFQPIHLDSVLQSADATYDSEMGAWGFGAELTSDTTQNAFIAHNEVRVENSAGGTSIGPTGITFPDSTTQTTAAVAGVTLDKALANAIAAHLWYTWDGFDYGLNGSAVINPNFTSGTYSSTFTYGISDGTNFTAGFPATANITILDSNSYWYVSVNGTLSDIDIHSP